LNTPKRPLVTLAALLVPTAAAQVELAYWDYWVTQAPAIDEIIAQFEGQNPDVRVVKNTVATGSYNEALDLAMRSNSGPDVFVLPNRSGAFLDYVNQGYLLDLSSFEDAQAFMESFPDPEKNFVEGSNMLEGGLYSAPFFGPNRPWLHLFVHTELYEEAGLVDDSGNLQLPVTWQDFLEHSRLIRERTDAYGTAFSLQQSWATGWWLRVCNYSSVPYDTGAFDFRTATYTFSSNPCYQQVLGDLASMAEEGLIHPATLSLSVDDEGVRALFAEGEFAHLVAGDWVIAGWEQTHPDFKSYTATHLPFPQEEPQGFFGGPLGGTWFGVNADTEHPEAAWAFFRFLHSPEAGRIWAERGNGTLIKTPEPFDQYATNDAFAYIFTTGDLVRIYPDPVIRKPELAQVQGTLLGPTADDITVGVLSGQITDLAAALADLDARSTEALETAIRDAQNAGVDVSIEDYKFPDWDPTQDYITTPGGN
jgi:ABC-type glycerol-3-phosphate transport system substrate-binding protein